jgi:hypothetical protein
LAPSLVPSVAGSGLVPFAICCLFPNETAQTHLRWNLVLEHGEHHHTRNQGGQAF